MGNKPLTIKIYIASLFASFICSMYPWFVWNNNLRVYVELFLAINAIVIFFQNHLYQKKIPIFFLLSFLLLSFFDKIYCNIFGILAGQATFIGTALLLFMDEDIKQVILKKITKWTAIFLAISLTAYILHLLNIFPITPTYIQYQNRYFSNNYFFFIEPSINFYLKYQRFRSIFMEPGHMCQGTIMLLIANRFNVKDKYVLILFVVSLFSFSLAAYIIMFLSMISFNLSKLKTKQIIICSLVIFSGCFYLYKTNNDDLTEKYLWERLEYSEKENTIKGNNRNTYRYIVAYERVISNIDTFLFGDSTIKEDDFEGGNSGYKRYIVEHGVIGLSIAILFYILIFFQYKTYNAFFTCLLTLLFLFPGPTPMWSCVIIPYLTSNSLDKTVVTLKERMIN